jgi:hypothetical protein
MEYGMALTFRCGKRRHPDRSVAYIKTRLLWLLACRTADDDFRLDKEPISKARAQAFYYLGTCWHTCLHNGVDWASFTPPPRWHHW